MKFLNIFKFHQQFVEMAAMEQPNFRSKVVQEAKERIIPQPARRWTSMIVYTLLVLLGQSAATLLGRLYYNEGGNTALLAALLETIGFPILIPFAFYFSSRNNPSRSNEEPKNHHPSNLIKSLIYIFLGLLQASTSVLYSIGLQYLPVSTFSLLNSTQLAFHVVFSFFFNAQKFTAAILNAVVLVTISSALLISQNDTGENPDGKSKTGHHFFVVGFLCTLVASALYSLTLSMTELAFQKVLKRETFSTVLKMIVYQSMVASFVIAVTIFIRGEWICLRNEMETFEMGKIIYVVVLVMIGVAWQVYSIGTVGLVFDVSSLFSNVIGAVGLPIVPIMAAIFFHEKMDGIKVISILLAIWGFLSYVYQHYLDENAGEDIEAVQESKNIVSQESQI